MPLHVVACGRSNARLVRQALQFRQEAPALGDFAYPVGAPREGIDPPSRTERRSVAAGHQRGCEIDDGCLLSSKLDHLAAAAAEDEAQVGAWRRCADRVRAPVMSSGVCRGRTRPHCEEEADELTQTIDPGFRLRHAGAGAFVILSHPARAESNLEPPIEQRRERHQFLDEDYWIV